MRAMSAFKVAVLTIVTAAIGNTAYFQSKPDTGLARTAHILRHGYGVTNVAWSPNGDLLATTGILSNEITVWDARNGTILRQMKANTVFTDQAAFSHDGKFLVTSLAEKHPTATLSLWDTATWQIASNIDGIPRDPRTRHTPARHFSSTVGNTIMVYLPVIGPGEPAAVIDTQTWLLKKAIPLEGHSTSALSLSPDGKTLAVGTILGKIAIVDIESNKVLQWINAYPNTAVGIASLAFSPDGQLLASGSTSSMASRKQPDGTLQMIPPPPDPVRVWQVSDGQLIRSSSGKYGSIQSIDWSPDGQRLAFTSDDKGAYLWRLNVETPDLIFLFDSSAFAAKFSPTDGNLLAVSGFNVVALIAVR